MTSNPSIHQAAAQGEIDSVRALLESDPTLVDAPDAHGWRPLFHAALGKQLAMVRLLIEAGADVSACDGDALHYAAEVPDNKPIVSLLLQYGALEAYARPTDAASRQVLAAIFIGYEKWVASMLARHPKLARAPDGRGDQPLHHAARCGETEIARLLLAHGGDIHALTARGHTVLYCAGGHGHLATMKLLLAHGADREVKFNADGKTLLEWLDQYPSDPRFQPIREELRRK